MTVDTGFSVRVSLSQTEETTFSTGVGVIRHAAYVDPQFLSLMVHYCDIERMQEGTASSSSYGHSTVSRHTVAATYPTIRCRLRDLTQAEAMSSLREDEVVEEYYLYIPIAFIPDTLRNPLSAVDHQVVNVRLLSGEPLHYGPLDIKNVRLIAGEQHHYLLHLRKAA